LRDVERVGCLHDLQLFNVVLTAEFAELTEDLQVTCGKEIVIFVKLRV